MSYLTTPAYCRHCGMAHIPLTACYVDSRKGGKL